ncbi:hypothetical protein SDC9_105810 [bioreactor metagenome]|uniref:Uncharacterized protein n=1 Tax=bioreactor metagenome TaxID=1076179 RepID=A0A645B0I3_9ZZZZ
MQCDLPPLRFRTVRSAQGKLHIRIDSARTQQAALLEQVTHTPLFARLFANDSGIRLEQACGHLQQGGFPLSRGTDHRENGLRRDIQGEVVEDHVLLISLADL